jgi:hypothetical protein
MQHVQAENVRYAVRLKRELLRVGDSVQPRTPDKVCRENVRRKLLKKTWARADFNGKSVWVFVPKCGGAGEAARELACRWPLYVS